MPNGEAINSVARGENNEGLMGSSIAKSIFGELVKRPSLGVFDRGGGGLEGDDSKRSRNGSGLGETL